MSSRPNLRQLIAIVVVAGSSSALAADDVGEPAAELRNEYASVSAEFRRDLDQLAQDAKSKGWESFAETASAWQPAAPSSGSLLFIAPDEYNVAAPAVELPADQNGEEAQLWIERFNELRGRHADDLYTLARRAAELHQPSLAFQWAAETVRENPNHADARRVLGYEKRDGKWLTAYGIRMAEDGRCWHPEYGWLAADSVAKYEAGERPLGARWGTADEDAARHRDLKKGWQIRTDHFQVTTNHSLEAAAELAARLEVLFQAWRQLFAGFYLGEAEVARLFGGGRDPRKQVRPFRVLYHRDRQHYNSALRRRQPLVSKTLGIYFDTFREAHFFAGEGEDLPTLYHEAVHQLFQESKPKPRKPIAVVRNFWVIEGVAAYFETLTEHRDKHAGLYFTIGEHQVGRIPKARERYAEGFYVPLPALITMGRNEVQRNPEIAKLYGQATALAAYLMDGEAGRYREPLVSYLEAVYTGRDNDDTLAEATKTSDIELDVAFRRYLESLPEN
jgi:hypothetical protein